MRPDTQSPGQAGQQQARLRRPQQGAVVALAVTLALLLIVWIVGAYLLIQYAPDLGELPGGDSSPSPTPTR
jgi:hypothetical protein